MDVSIISDIIRWPFEMFGKILNFLINYIIEIVIIVVTIYIIYLIFKSWIIKKISNAIIEYNIRIKKEGENLWSKKQ